ncbi:Imm50 family immunity protein [Paenibacillus bovis]|uniref:Uncharacterized protein n=1 Tax=Paenibacillus bovis TaxID=1616788 RepID=A0A172ZFH9_9BACL|nr:Imm50 family immunity protein [Paenibacillus bovis]ANF96385.1 hypothetical protein AR543_10465 [Paenibacillus bovis]
MEVRIEKVEQNGKEYTIRYQLEKPLPFDLHDIVMLQAGDYVVGSVRQLDAEQITLYISKDELNWGDKTIIQLAFSPTVSIRGSKEIIAELGHFPDFEEGIITGYEIGKDQVELTIQLPEPLSDREVKLTFLEAFDIEFSPPDARLNVIAEVDFRYDGTDMVVDIEAAQGLSGSFFCGGIQAELVQNEN